MTYSEILAPYGDAWGKVRGAFERKIATLTDPELEQLVEACRVGRRTSELAGDEYWASFEVERLALSKLGRTGAHRR